MKHFFVKLYSIYFMLLDHVKICCLKLYILLIEYSPDAGTLKPSINYLEINKIFWYIIIHDRDRGYNTPHGYVFLRLFQFSNKDIYYREKKKKNIITCSYPTNHHKYFADMKDSFKEHQGTKTIPKKHPSSYTINTTQYKIASLILTIITIVT